MTVAALAAAGAALVLVVLAAGAYRRGRRRPHALLPAEVVEELTQHKLRCLGEPPERVALEVALLLGAGRAPRSPSEFGRAPSAPGRDARRS